MERKTGFEPATPTLARWYSTAELLPHVTGLLGFEPRLTGPKPVALPLGYSPMGRPVGIEPTNAGATIRCVNHFATIAVYIITGVVGVEPTSTVLETVILAIKLYPYIGWRGADSNCRTRWERIYSPPRLATSLPLHIFYFNSGGLGRNRTADTRFFRPLLYRLSYQALCN